MPRANRSSRKPTRSGAQIGYEGAIGHEVTGIEPGGLGTSGDEDDLALDGLYVDDIPKESSAAPAAPGGRKKGRSKKRPAAPGRAADRRRAADPALLAPAEGPETTTELPPPRIQPGPSIEPGPGVDSGRGPGLGVDPGLSMTGTGPSGRLSYAAGVLQCTKGPEEGLALNLIEGSYTIGRARENNFVLKDIAASREHLRIVVEDNIVRAVDLGSGNGTKINGARMGEVVLKNGDRIEIGNSVLVFTYLGRDRSMSVPHAAAPLPVERPPTQERIVMAAEKLAAELSERFRREDDGLDELPGTSVERSLSNPRVPPPRDDFRPQQSFVDDDDMAEAIQQMARDISSPSRPTGASLADSIPRDQWADSETATRLPVGDEAARARGYSGALPRPQGRASGASASARSASVDVRAAAEPKRGSGAAMFLVALLIVMVVGGGGIGAYLLLGPTYGPRLRAMVGLPGATADTQGEPLAGEGASTTGPGGASAGGDVNAGDGKPGETPGAGKPADGQAVAAKPGDAKPAGAKAADAKPVDGKAVAAKPSDAKASDAKPADAKPADAKPADAKPAEAKPAEAKPAATKVAAAPAKRDDKPAQDTRVAKAEAKPRDKPAPSGGERTASARREDPKPDPKPRAQPKPRAKPQKRAPPPRSAPSSSGGSLDDEDAKGLFTKAVIALKKSDNARACLILDKVKRQAAKDSVWQIKADRLHERSCP